MGLCCLIHVSDVTSPMEMKTEMGCGIPTWVMNPALVYFGSVPFDDVYDVYDGMLGRLPGNRRGQKCRNFNWI